MGHKFYNPGKLNKTVYTPQYITNTTKVNSAFYSSGVGKSSSHLPG